MKDAEKIIDSIVRDVPKERRSVWVNVFEEKIVGKRKIPMSDLNPLKDDECFKRLEFDGFIRIDRPSSEKWNQTGNPHANIRLEANNTFAIPNDDLCKLLLEQLQEALKPTY